MIEPAPRPYFDVPGPDHQPVTERDVDLFLHRTMNRLGHTFTESGRK